MEISLLLKLATPVLIVAAYPLLARRAAAADADIDPSSGATILRYGSGLWVVPWAFWLCSVGITAFLLIAEQRPGAAVVVGAIIAAMATGFALELRSQVRFDQTAISTRSVWSGKRTLRWEDVDEIVFLTPRGLFQLRGRSGTKMLVRSLLEGVPAFVANVETRLADRGGTRAAQLWRHKATGSETPS